MMQFCRDMLLLPLFQIPLPLENAVRAHPNEALANGPLLGL